MKGVGGIRVTIPKPGGFHQDGTVKMDARPIVPDGDLPDTWSNAVAEATRTVLARDIK